MLQYVMVFSTPSNIYTVYTVLFHKGGEANVSVKNCMSHFSMFVPTKSTVKLSNVSTVYAQAICIIFCVFTNCYILYPVGSVYYCPGRPSHTITSVAFKFYVVLQKVTSETLVHCDFVDPKGHSWRLIY